MLARKHSRPETAPNRLAGRVAPQQATSADSGTGTERNEDEMGRTMTFFKTKTAVALMAVMAMLAMVTACSSPTSGQTGTPTSGGTSASGAVHVAGDLAPLEQLYTGMEGTPPADGPSAVAGKTVYLVSCGEAYPPCAVMGEEMKKGANVLGWFRLLPS